MVKPRKPGRPVSISTFNGESRWQRRTGSGNRSDRTVFANAADALTRCIGNDEKMFAWIKRESVREHKLGLFPAPIAVAGNTISGKGCYGAWSWLGVANSR
ncbi:MAG TPA: hypothetical protein VFW34_06805 [Candidatus Rubrimentiphilum sp.]|nr:hypothetical protein [Candidatus Rubrimentiphilum sp.]